MKSSVPEQTSRPDDLTAIATLDIDALRHASHPALRLVESGSAAVRAMLAEQDGDPAAAFHAALRALVPAADYLDMLLLRDALRRGDDAAAIALLTGARLDRCTIWQDHPDLLSAALQERLRLLILTGIRDCDDGTGALAILTGLHAVWPGWTALMVEILSILGARSPDEALRHAETLAPALRDRPAVALLIAHHALRAGAIDLARTAWSAAARLPDPTLRPYAAMYDRIGARLQFDGARAALLHGPAAIGLSHDLAAVQPALATGTVVEALAAMLRCAERDGTLWSATRGAAYINDLTLPQPCWMTSTALARAVPWAGSTLRMVAMALALSARDAETGHALLLRLMEDDAAARQPFFLKWALFHAIETRDHALERRLLSATGGIASDNPARPDLTATQTAELEERALALGLRGPLDGPSLFADMAPPPGPGPIASREDDPVTIFVGFFGQLRDYEAVLADTVRFVTEDFARRGIGRPFRLLFGLSTWQSTGARTLELVNGTEFFLELLPGPVRTMVGNLLASDGYALAERMPNLVRTMLDHVRRTASVPLRTDDFDRILPDDAKIRLGDEARIDAELAAIMAAGVDIVPPNRNQFKMWSRLEELGGIVDAFEEESGVPVDLCVFLRADLRLEHGSIAAAAADLLDTRSARDVFIDFDPHAAFIEGIGDRYFIGRRDGMRLLSSGYDLLRTAHVVDDRRNRFRPRIGCHEGPSSLLFAGGYDARMRDDIGYAIHRGLILADALRTALEADLRATPDDGVRAAIAALLATPFGT